MLKAENRLRAEKDIKALLQKGKSISDVFFILKFRPNNQAFSRFAIVTGIKVSKSAVVRNRLRRQVREIIRLDLDGFTKGLDIILLMKKNALEKDFEELSRHILGMARKVGIWH